MELSCIPGRVGQHPGASPRTPLFRKLRIALVLIRILVLHHIASTDHFRKVQGNKQLSRLKAPGSMVVLTITEVPSVNLYDSSTSS